ncbi:hypothetical protein SBF1_50072 [Candidatus Desulfosporosinus infrequens]|uniref:Methyltransferase n=1 Tax=Candidatus Desulfosporosinus infrequens TaxID=2043169 RepID=A0A2U3LH21_9FIRM|nr:hypothetical protein SBF1_50072 [Candidatus Desulfosporosinus infrequens]
MLDSIILGDCLEVMKGIPANSIDSGVTDAPYELGFMGKSWDNTGIAYNVAMWKEFLRVLKPGGYLLSFGGSRTYHRMACAIEDAGFEIRDQIMWIYGSGFPKSYNIAKGIEGKLLYGSANTKDYCKLEKTNFQQQGMGFNNIHLEQGDRPASYELGGTFDLDAQTDEAKQWDGWGTALKPAHEPIVVARKPLSEKTVAANVLKWGTGGININDSRIGTNDDRGRPPRTPNTVYGNGKGTNLTESQSNPLGRFPANIIFDEVAAAVLDEQTGILKSGTGAKKGVSSKGYQANAYARESRPEGTEMISYGDSGGASRFFYCAKASKRERGEGNNHPTVKPLDLMKYLIKLVTPQGGTVLDPFIGSGTTALAAKGVGCHFIGIDKEKAYAGIARARIGVE